MKYFYRISKIFLLAFFSLTVLCGLAKADSLTITYNGDQNQTVVVQNSTFATAILTGFITNNSDHAITFQLSGGPVPFEPYVASFISGIPYPGITLGAGMSTGIIQLAVVNINPFDRSLMYPGLVTIVLPAIDKTGMILSGADGNTAALRVVTPEPSTLLLLLISSIGVLMWKLKVMNGLRCTV